MKLKVFEFGDTDWIAAISKKAAVREYANMGGGEEEAFVEELTDNEIDTYLVFDDLPFDKKVNKNFKTFREVISSLENDNDFSARCIASTEI